MLLKKNNTIRFKFVSRYFIVFIVLLVTLYTIVLIIFNTYIENKIDKLILDQLNRFDWLNTFEQYNYNIDKIESGFNYSATPEGLNDVFYILYNKDRIVYTSSDLTNWEGVDKQISDKILNDTSSLNGYNITILNRSKNKAYKKTISYKKKNTKVRIGVTFLDNDYIFLYGISLSNDHAFKKQLSAILIISFIIIFMAGFTIVFVLISKVMKGIDRVTITADRIEKGNLQEEVSSQNEGQEIENLINSFNRMIQRIFLLMNEIKGVSDDIAHDLRSPVTSIRALSEITLTGNSNIDDYKITLEKIINKCDYLISIINTLLEIAEIETGKLQTQSDKIDMNDILQNAYELYLSAAEVKAINYSFKTNKTPQFVKGIKSNLERATANIIDNAIKYTPRGGMVKLLLYMKNDQIIIEVIDNGIGIEQAEIQKIFNKFYRVESSRSTKGNGLGLSLAQAVINNHGGKINITSKLKSGTNCKIILPAIKLHTL